MSAWMSVIRHRRRLAAESQGGYVLMMTIAVIGFLGILVIALLGAVFADLSSRSVYARQERDRRAVDGALQLGVDRIKTSPGALLGGTGGCAGLASSVVNIEGRDVTLGCSADAIAAVPSPGGPSDGPVLTLLSNYNGQLDDLRANTLGSFLGSAIGALADALNTLLLNGPGLVHYGPEPLRFVGDVGVRQTALGRNESAPHADASPAPAFAVAGNYRQGDVGPLGNQQFSVFGIPLLTTPACGVLDRNVGSGSSDIGLQLHATGTESCNVGRSNVTGPTFTAPTAVTTAQRMAGTALPAGGCVSGSVVSFTPGPYNRSQTTMMNSWFSAANTTCHNVTFYFPPGDYFFDVGGWFNGDRNSLAFEDPTSNWVFGTPEGWTPPSRATSATFPEACDRTAAGVSITTSARTAIKHKGGLVAICGTPGSSTRATIFQETGAPAQDWGATATSAANIISPDFRPVTDPEKAARSNSPAPGTYPGFGGDWIGTEPTREYASVNCPGGCKIGMRFTGFSDPGEPAPSGTLTKALIKIRGYSYNVAAFGDLFAAGVPSTTVIIRYGDGSTSYNQCQINVNDVPRNDDPNFLTIDLLAGCRNATYQLIDATQLENATVDIHMALPVGGCVGCTPPPAQEFIDQVWMETSTTSQTSSTYSTVVNSSANEGMSVFGNVYVPNSNVEIGWRGTAGSMPIFVGQVVARGLGSLNTAPGVQVGVAAARALAPPNRHVKLRAVVGGRLRGTAEVEVTDLDPVTNAVAPGRLMKIVDWVQCNRDVTATSC